MQQVTQQAARFFAPVTTAALVVTLALLSACSTNPEIQLYDGHKRSKAEIMTVRAPVELEILSINDRRIEGASTMFAFGSRDLQLLPGEYRIVAFYKNLFDTSPDQHEIVKSDPSIFTVNGNPGDVFLLNFDKPQNLEAAKAMAKDFTGWTENLSSGAKIASKPSGFILSSGFIGLTSAATSTQQEAVSSVAPENSSATEGNSASQKPTTSNLGALQSLQENWNAASAEERREFLLWMSQ
tara:strand:- start:126229 stop:126948 length:720 start_codon:yes stop_codon:yes gene_type:complete